VETKRYRNRTNYGGAGMMRVAFVDQSGDHIGGAEHSLALLLGALPADVGAEAIVFGDGAFAQRLRDLGIRPRVIELSPSLATTKRERMGTRGILEVPTSVFALAREIAGLHPDLVYTNTVKAHLLAAPAARLARVRCVAHLRDILEGPARMLIRGVLASCTKQRIAISGAVRDAFALGKTDVIPNPLDLSSYATLPTRAEARRALNLPADGKLVSIIGRINRWKGHDRFVRIAGALRDCTGNGHAAAGNGDAGVHFAIVGAPIFRDADFMDELHAQVQELGLQERVVFVPWLEDPRIAYAATDILCNTSDNEPFGRTLIEAAACSVPAVCFDSGGTAEAVINNETGFVVPAGDETQFTAALRRLLEEPPLLERMSTAAREASQRFDARIHAERVANVLRRTAG
jgi:glycosyltransferase involved in cell wall biosynthesis